MTQAQEVVALLDRVKTLTLEEAQALEAAYVTDQPVELYTVQHAATEAVVESSQHDMWKVARDAVLKSVPRAAHEMVWFHVREAAYNAVLAIIARDLITPEQYEVLYKPWASVMGGK